MRAASPVSYHAGSAPARRIGGPSGRILPTGASCYAKNFARPIQTDTYDPLPTAGRMGLFLNDTALIGTFVNYAVYPVQPPSSLLYV